MAPRSTSYRGYVIEPVVNGTGRVAYWYAHRSGSYLENMRIGRKDTAVAVQTAIDMLEGPKPLFNLGW